MNSLFHIGACSWKFDAWRGLVYSDAAGANYLAEYARKYDCVEVDQWFWSLFGPDKVVLPSARTVEEYATSVPAGFRFGVKLPNALTLTHFHNADKTAPLESNPHFLSVDLLGRFLERLEPMRGHLGPMMLQFGYLNKQMVPSQATFLERLDTFVSRLPVGYTWCIETRNPNWLNAAYFNYLRERRLAHVWQMGYYMPPPFEIYAKQADRLASDAVVRLHGPDRAGMEARVGKDWSKIIEPHDAELDELAGMLKDLVVRKKNTWAFVNNHFEGCAPQTIERIEGRMAG
jgi:uncharacterized protein YecE (DUF72 family)